MKKLSITSIALLLAGGAFAQTTWNIDKAHSKIGFAISHMMVSEVEGQFKDYDGKVVATSDDFNGATIEFTAKIASVDTENERRDTHLKTADYFDAEKFPEIKFSGKLAKDGSKFKLKGDFTLHGVTKPIEMDVTYGGTIKSGNATKSGFKVTGTIDRTEYGMTNKQVLDGGGLGVGEEVEIVCRLELNKAAD